MPAAASPASTSRTVLITGAAGGLGRSFALGFADAGHRVVAADIDASGAEDTASAIRDTGATGMSAYIDVTSAESTQEVAELTAEFGGGTIDVVINNAAMYATVHRSPLEDIDPQEWDSVMAVNLKGPWLVVRACSRYLTGGSSVVNIASATVFSGSENWLHYVTSKGGVIAMSRVMAKELGRRDITVNTIAPGFTLTKASYGLMDNAAEYGVDRGAIRRASQPDDIVGAALFLAGPHSNYVSGQTLVVDGGRQFI